MPPHHYITTSLLNMFHCTFWSVNFNVLITGLVNLLVNTFRKAPSTYLLYRCDMGNTCSGIKAAPKSLAVIKVNSDRYRISPFTALPLNLTLTAFKSQK